MSATNHEPTTLDRVYALARRLSASDQARLIGLLAPLLADAIGPDTEQPRPLRGLLADLGVAPSDEDIEDVRHEMWRLVHIEDPE